MKTFRSALDASHKILSKNSDLVQRGTVEIESEILVISAWESVSGKRLSRMEFFSRIKEDYPESAAAWLESACLKRAQGIPLQYITRRQVFLENEYVVNEAVLVPRPETEVFVVSVIEELSKRRAKPEAGLEIGIGSGIISIELLKHFETLQMTATELSAEAIEVALENAGALLGETESSARLKIIKAESPGDVFGCLPGGSRFEFIVSNPPYLNPIEAEVESDVWRHEPGSALFAPEGDLLYFYRQIAASGKSLLLDGGIVACEIPHERAEQILELFAANGWNARIIRDLTMKSRVLIATLKA